MGSTTNGTQSESQTAFIVAAVVLLGLPFIVLLGMAAFVMATGTGLVPGSGNDLPSETASKLMIFLVVWGLVSVVAVLMFVVRLLRRSSN